MSTRPITAVYIAPAALEGHPFDALVRAWVAEQGFVIVPFGQPHEAVVYVPYDGGGCCYHHQVSASMAAYLATAIRDSVSVHGIEIKDIDTTWIVDREREIEREAIKRLHLGWCGTNYRTLCTLGIMTHEKTEAAERTIRLDNQLGYRDIGFGTRPIPGRAARD